MEKEQILKIGKSIAGKASYSSFYAYAAEVKNFVGAVAGKNNSFYEAIDKVKITAYNSTDHLNNILQAFLRSVESDLVSNVSFERKLKIEVVNDYLVQAEELLDKEEMHPVAATVLAGGSLEEFLREWVSDENLDLATRPSIDAYATALKKNNLITKQEFKEIAAWGGVRNQAAHGHWKEVENREKIRLMLGGIQLFIKKYSK